LQSIKCPCPVAQEVADIIFPGEVKSPAGGRPVFIDGAFDPEGHFALQGNAAGMVGSGALHDPLGPV